MTGETGYTRKERYEFWHVFAEQPLRRFGPTHEAEKSLKEIGLVKYHCDVAKFVMELENLNIDARVTGIAWGKMIEYELPMGTPRQEVKTASSELPDIKILDTYCKSLSEEALRAETGQAR